MQHIFLGLHILIAVMLIGLILVQQGKGADAGAAFGSGASGTVFGSRGSAPALVKLTAVLGAIFFISAMSLSLSASHASRAGMLQVPTVKKHKALGHPGVSVNKHDVPMVKRVREQRSKHVASK